MRSLLLAPADDEARLTAALASEADAIVIGLDVAPAAKPAARLLAARFLKVARARGGAPALMIRVSPLGDGETDLDLDAVMPAAPVAILLPNSVGGAGVQQLSAKLAVREALFGLDDCATGVIAIVDNAQGLLDLKSYRGSSPRLIGLAWDAQSLTAHVGAEAGRDAAGAYTGPCGLARDMTLIAAAAAGVAAIDTAVTGALDPERLRGEALAARRDGFVAKLAIDPDQARLINEAFGSRHERGT